MKNIKKLGQNLIFTNIGKMVKLFLKLNTKK